VAGSVQYDIDNYLGVLMFHVPLTVAAVAALSVSLAPVAAADTLGAQCTDWMKISADSTTGAKMFCAAPPGTGDDALTWTAWSQGAWSDAPPVGPVGSPCSGPNYAFGLSSDDYIVWCYAGGKVLLPGGDGYVPAASSSVWSLYSP
jgi:hypothetical protein